jgi:pilus assembly protein CpaE
VTRPIRTTVALGEAIDRAAVETACAEQPTIALEAFVDARPESLAGLGPSSGEALVVACHGEMPEVLGFIRGAVEQRPGRPVVVLYDGTANGFVREAIDAGADDLIDTRLGLGADVGPQLAFALEKALVRRAGGGPGGADQRRGQMITVLGPKGGTGKTLTSCNLGVALAGEGHRVVLLDLDLQFGDVGLSLGLDPERTIYFLVTQDSGLRVLLAPRRPDQAGAVRIEFLRELFEALRPMTDFIVVDTPPSFSPEVIAAIDFSESLCVVAMLDALSLKNTRLALETLDLMRIPPEAIRVVLNRADTRVGVSTEDAEHLLGRRPDVLVPSSRDITRSVNEASPIVASAGNNEARGAFLALASAFAPRASAAQVGGVGRRSLLRRGRGS